jgi:N-acetylmuramoyl-L-alanine amidase
MASNLGARVGRAAPQTKKRNVVWLNAGHGGNPHNDTYDPGAPVNKPDGTRTWEAEYTHRFVADIAKRVVEFGGDPPKVLNHGGAPGNLYWAQLVQMLNEQGKPGQYLISYHFNSAPEASWPHVSGTETLYTKGSEHGRVLARHLTDATCKVLGIRTPRQNVPLDNPNVRGASILINTPQYAALHEVAYTCNPAETALVDAHWDALVDIHARIIIHLQTHGVGTADPWPA